MLIVTSKYKVMPLEYRNVFSDLDRNFNLPYTTVCESDEIYWILLPSLIHSNEKIWVPCDMILWVSTIRILKCQLLVQEQQFIGQ